MALLVFLLDVASKGWVHHHLPLMGGYDQPYPYGGIPVFENWGGIEFSISHATNKGAAWGIGAAYQNYLLIGRLLLVAFLFFYYFRPQTPNWQKIPLLLITAGAIGNIVDWWLYGHVVDMLHFVFWGYDYPVFNIADSAIFIGVFWLLLGSWWNPS